MKTKLFHMSFPVELEGAVHGVWTKSKFLTRVLLRVGPILITALSHMVGV